jgi:Ca2+-binding RTX toxin-like protein
LAQYTDLARISRTGNAGQNLVIETAYKPNYYSSAGIETGTIKIVNQYSATVPTAQIEKYIAGGVEYYLPTTDTGTAFNDIMTGWHLADTIHAGDGDDYVSGGRGGDVIFADAGADIVFGGNGGDVIRGGAGTDRLFGENGNDKLIGGDDIDRLEGQAGKDILKGGNGDDSLSGGDQNDRLVGGFGDDMLMGDAGDDTLIGGKGGDTYVVSSIGSDSDTIIDNGKAPVIAGSYYTSGMDELQITGFTSQDAAMHGIDLQRSGDDLVVFLENTASPGETAQVTVQDHFAGPKFALDQITFAGSWTSAVLHISDLSGDGLTYSVHNGPDQGGDDIVLGTAGDDQIYGGIGSDIMLGGTGADKFMFHDEEDNRGGTDVILDFDPTVDRLDFTDIKTLTRAGLTIGDNSYGNAVISSTYGAIELKGVATLDFTDAIFDFF